MSEINVREIAEGKEVKAPLDTYPADLMAALRAKELAGAIETYANSPTFTVAETEQCMVYAEELMDQLALMKKYGKQDAKWLAGGFR